MSGCCHSAASKAAEPPAPQSWLRLLLALFVAGNQMVVALAVNLSDTEPSTRASIHLGLTLATGLVLALVGGDLFSGTVEAVRARAVRTEAMFLLGIGAALALSVRSSLTGAGDVFYEVVSVLLVAYAFGRRVRRRAQAGLRNAVAEWPEAADACEVVVDEAGRTEPRPVRSVVVGDQVRVAPGHRVPVDGVIRDGEALVQDAPVSGEPFVRRVGPGHGLLASAHVLDASLVVEATAAGTARVVDRLQAAVEAAHRRAGPLQGEAQRVLRVFLPVVALASLGAGAAWFALDGVEAGVFTALAVLLVACPCALGFATPIATLTALTHLARRGLRLAGGDVVERLAEIDTVVFDKTGTLSVAEPRLRRLDPAGEWRAEALADLCALAEQDSLHPIAAAFKNAAESIDGHPVAHRVLAGRGVEAEVVYRGARHVVRIEARGGGGATHLLDIHVDDRAAGVAEVDEALHAHLGAARSALEGLGLEIHVLSGDRPERVARLGWPGSGALDPEDKSAWIAAAQRDGRRVLFVGDGINDAPALAEAYVGVAVADGAPLAHAAADGIWFGGDPRVVAEAVSRARHTARHLRQSLRYAALYNGLGMAAAAVGLFGPVLAAVLMTASSLFVTARAGHLHETPAPVPSSDSEPYSDGVRTLELG